RCWRAEIGRRSRMSIPFDPSLDRDAGGQVLLVDGDEVVVCGARRSGIRCAFAIVVQRLNSICGQTRDALEEAVRTGVAQGVFVLEGDAGDRAHVATGGG